MKTAFCDVVGNHALKLRLQNDLSNQKNTHAYILEGAKGTGKHMLALRIAAALACEKKDDPNLPFPCLTCPACRKILSGNSPDVIYVNREDKATIGVDPIRALRQDVYVAPNENATKIYIIEDAHLMNTHAQNAFLLTLEEPPPYVLFLLLCESATPLLETIRSRAPTLRTEPIAAEEIGEHLCKISTDALLLSRSSPAEFAELLASANGSIGFAKGLLDERSRKPILERRRIAKEFATLCAARKNPAATMRFLISLGQKRDEILEQFSVIQYCMRDLLLCKQTENAPLCFFADREEALTLAYEFTTPRLLRLCDSISECKQKLSQNANVRLMLTDFAVSIGLL